MFSGFELTVIKSWALSGKEILKDHLQSKIFTHAEKEDKRREYAALDSIIEEANRIQREYAAVDADHMMHLWNVCTGYRSYVRTRCEHGDLSTEDYAAETYQIGYMQGRIELGLLTQKDITVIEQWEETIE